MPSRDPQDERMALAARAQGYLEKVDCYMVLTKRECRILIDALRAQPERAAADDVTPAMIAAAWGAWRVRHPHLSMGPGPGFSEAISAAFKARALPLSPAGEGE